MQDLSTEFRQIFMALKPTNKKYAMAILRSLQFAQEPETGPGGESNTVNESKAETSEKPT